METLIYTAAFALVAAYGALSVSDPSLSLRLDRTATRTDPDAVAVAVRNRRYAGWVALAVSVFGSTFLVSLSALAISLAAALLTIAAVAMR